MNPSLDVITTTATCVKSIQKIVPKFVITELSKAERRSGNLILLRLWHLKVEFEDGLINFKRLLLKAEKRSEFLIFNFNIFHLMTVDEKKKEFLNKLCLASLWGMLLFVLVLYALLTLGSILKRYSGAWPLNILNIFKY